MENFVDHYLVLGLPSGEEALELTDKDIRKAYMAKALELHPDKRPDDPNARENFQQLKASYEVLKDKEARKLLDELLRVRRENQWRQTQKKSQGDARRRKMMSDLEERERAGFAPNSAARPYDDEERIKRKLDEQVARIRAEHAKKKGGFQSPESGVDKKRKDDRRGGGASVELDKERVLKVSWETIGEGYTAESLREVFSEFGQVEDVVIRSTKKKSSALVVMATKDGAVAATRMYCGHLSNPLLVVPLLKAAQNDFVTAKKSAEEEPQSNIVGAGYQAYEDEVLEKVRKAAKNQKR